MHTLSDADSTLGAAVTAQSRYWTFANLFALVGFGFSTLGAAIADAVMLGLIGFPMAMLGLVIGAMTAPLLIHPSQRGGRRILSLAMAVVAGALATGGAVVCTFAASEALVHHEGNAWGAAFAASGSALAAHWMVWLAAPALGLAAACTGRGRLDARGVVLASFWAAVAPVSLLLLSALFRIGIVAFSA